MYKNEYDGKHWDFSKMLLTHQILPKIRKSTKMPCTSVSETSSTWTHTQGWSRAGAPRHE